MHTHTYIHIHTYIHAHTHIYIYTHTNIHVCMHAYTCISVYIYMCVCAQASSLSLSRPSSDIRLHGAGLKTSTTEATCAALKLHHDLQNPIIHPSQIPSRITDPLWTPLRDPFERSPLNGPKAPAPFAGRFTTSPGSA